MFYGGYIEGEPGSEVSLYILDGVMEANIHLSNDTYYVEKAGKHFPNASVDFTHIVYRRSDLIYNFDQHQHFEGSEFDALLKTQSAILAEFEANKTFAESIADRLEATRTRRSSFNIASNNTCELGLVADQTFYAGPDGQSNVATATASMVYWTTMMNYIYKNTNFTNVGYGIQFAIKQVQIYTADNVVGNPYANFASTSATDFLNVITQGDPTNGNSWNHVCVAHAFTTRTFSGGILGLAWVGAPGASGICGSTAGGKSLNSGISTDMNFGASLPAIVSYITYAHEVGHNFGSTVCCLFIMHSH